MQKLFHRQNPVVVNGIARKEMGKERETGEKCSMAVSRT